VNRSRGKLLLFFHFDLTLTADCADIADKNIRVNQRNLRLRRAG
jgi:hypothetical protein